MRAALVAAAVLAASAHAQRQHTTQDELGNSVVIATTTDADGDPATTTLRTVYTYPGADGADELTTTGRHTTTLWDDNGDPIITTWTGTRTPTLATTAVDGTTTKDAVDDGAAQGGQKGIQGPPTTTYPPMTATTYGYKNQAGDWVTTEWTQSYTAPTEATADVSQGTIQGLQEYKDAQKSFSDKAVQPGSAMQGSSSGAERRVAAGGAATLLAAVAFYAF